ncbi:hypothetical protein D9M72_655570 [compost metagenome]
MLFLGVGVVAFHGMVVVVVHGGLGAFAGQCSLEGSDGGRNLLDRDDALRRGRFADDVEQLARMHLEHHEVRSGPGFEAVEHGVGVLTYL